MNKQNQNESLFDALLNISVIKAFDHEMNALPSIEETNEIYQPSPELAAQIKKQIEKDNRKKRLTKLTKTTRKAAACIAVVFTLAAVTLFSVEASRNFILNAVLDWQKGSTGIRFEETSSGVEDGLYRPAYLPEGFKEVSSHIGKISTIIEYENSEGIKIRFSQKQKNIGETFVDNDHTSYTEVPIDGKTAYLFKADSKETANTLIWENNGTVFWLSSVIDSKELIKIAENLKK